MQKEFIGLRSANGKTEYNARAILGDALAESLEINRWYTLEELNPRILLGDIAKVERELKMKWQRVSIND